jgi:CoA-transferase family III
MKCHPALLAVLAEEGERLKTAARALGGTITFDPAKALERTALPDPPPAPPPDRTCTLMQAADGWIALNLAREDDRLAIPAWLGIGANEALCAATLRSKSVADLIAQATLLGMPVAAVGEQALFARDDSKVKPPPTVSLSLSKGRLSSYRTSSRTEESSPSTRSGIRGFVNDSMECHPTLKVLDLSALWAGPYCGALFAEAGMAVTKVESPARPDPTGPDPKLNGRKRHVSLALTDPALIELIEESDILITSARPHALARLGLSEERLFALNPRLIWVAITAYGWTGEGAMRVGFGDDCAAAGGLVDWAAGEPRFIGDALADPLTGLAAAIAGMEAAANGQAGLIDISLASTSAAFAIRAGYRA